MIRNRDWYEDTLATTIMEWVRRWWDRHVVAETALTAAVSAEDLPAAILREIVTWQALVDAKFPPLVRALLIARIYDACAERGFEIPEEPAPVRVTFDPTELEFLAVMGIAEDAARLVMAVPSWRDFIAEYATRYPTFLPDLPQQLYVQTMGKLASAVQKGDGIFDRARIVREALDMGQEGGYDQWMIRARRIARTEATRMVNAGTLRAAMVEEELGGESLEKVWIATLDPRTRDDHFAADGQRVPLAADFTLGGYPCAHPGDSRLPASESINCRCAVMVLAVDDPLPDETRRLTGHRSRTRVYDPVGEIEKRADKGVTRARDDGQDQSLVAGAHMRVQFSAQLAPMGERSGDGRIIDDTAAITWRDTPLPLLWQENTDFGHDGAAIVGRITAGMVEDGAITAVGEFFDTPEAARAVDLVREGVLRPSVDLCDVTAEFIAYDADGNPIDDDPFDHDGYVLEHVRSGCVMAATLVATPAFSGVSITLGEAIDAEDDNDRLSLVAAGINAPVYPATAFEDPRLDAPTPLTVTENGTVYGHLALWGTEHVGLPGARVMPPHSASDYAFFHVSTVDTSDGALPVGRLTVGCGHAAPGDGSSAAAAHYDTVGTCWALVRAGEDAHGIWVAGVVNPDAKESDIRAGAQAPLSGDWRRIGGSLELVAALSVNVPGFPVPRSYVGDDRKLSLVAAGVCPRMSSHDKMVAAVLDAFHLREQKALQAQLQEQRVAGLRRLEAEVLAAQLRGV